MKIIITTLFALLLNPVANAHKSSDLGAMVFEYGEITKHCMYTANLISALSTNEVLYASFCTTDKVKHKKTKNLRNTVFTKIALPGENTKTRYNNADYPQTKTQTCAENLHAVQLLGVNNNGISINAYCTADNVLKSWIILDDSYNETHEDTTDGDDIGDDELPEPKPIHY